MSDNISILVKLFETLKTSTDKNEEATQGLIVQQLDLVGHIKHLPIQDLKDALEVHSKDSKKEVDNCSENVDIKTSNLMVEVANLNNKVSKMILVVVVAFTIVMASLGIINRISDKSKLYNYEVIETSQSKEFNDSMDTLLNEINEIRNDMKSLHSNDNLEDDSDESVYK